MPPNTSNPYNNPPVNPPVKPPTFTPPAPAPVTPPRPATPPPTPPIQPQATKGGRGGEKKALLPALLVLLVLVAGYAWYAHRGGSIANPLSNSFTSENVSMGQVNVAEGQTEGAPLPDAFPSDFPIVLKNITDQKVLHYPDRNVDLYSVTYTSKLQPEELYATYNTYFNSNMFNVISHTKTATEMSFEAEKNGASFTVVITPQVDGAVVNLAVVVRK